VPSRNDDQYSILTAARNVPSLPLRKPEGRLELDPTPLKSLAPLERNGVVLIDVEPNDTRVRAMSTTEADQEAGRKLE